jgi:hypothetical protein
MKLYIAYLRFDKMKMNQVRHHLVAKYLSEKLGYF